MFACIHWPDADNLLALAGDFSPWVEQLDADTVLFSIDGLTHLHGNAHAIARAIATRAPQAHIAIAATPDAAILAARHIPGAGVIPQGEEIRYLGSLPLHALPLDPDTAQILYRWGLETLEDFAALPETGLHERLGANGVRLQRLARGALGRPLKPVIPDTVYQSQIELDYTIGLIEPLLFLLARFLDELCAQLKSQSLAAAELHLTFNQTERTLRLPFPTRDTKFLLKLLQHNLETTPTGEPVARVVLRISPTEPRLFQHDLFSLPAPEPERLELTLTKIRSMVGQDNVKTPVIQDTHKPGWGPAETHLAFRHFRPPIQVRVDLHAGKPQRLRAPGLQAAVVQISGPWKSSGNWWRTDTWDRDEFDLELNDGTLCRLYYDRQSQSWMLEGIYD